MSELRTDFKDEILQEGEEHRTYNIKRKGTNEVVESDIYLEKAYEPQQEGDNFGAKEVNEINGHLNGLAPQSITINSDFQINQRGQSIYDYSNEPKKYCLDMWYVTKMKVEILENGCIKVTNNDTTRHAILQDIDKVIGKHILCVYVEEKTGEASEKNSFQLVYFKNNQQINGKSFNNETGLIYEVVDYEINKVGVIVPSNCTITLKFIKLFEGDILYKCQKEEHTIALMRCYQYVFSTTQKRLVGKVGTAHLEGFDFPIRMKSTPLYTVIEFESTNGNDLKNELDGISATSRGVVYMSLQNPTQQEYQYTILFSCEPL